MNRIIVALKKMTPKQAVEWAKKLEGKIWGLKFNDMLRNDLSFIQDVRQYCNVMADPKLFDIPDDMENQFRQLVDAGCNIVTVHTSAMWIPPEDLLDKAVGVTILTSFDDKKSEAVYAFRVVPMVDYFMGALGRMRYKWVVCSAADLREKTIAEQVRLHHLKPICPSIRMSGGSVKGDDQVRKATPAEAHDLGVEFMVIGRPILQAPEPVAMVNRINNEIFAAEKNIA